MLTKKHKLLIWLSNPDKIKFINYITSKKSFTVKEVSEAIGVAQSTLNDWMKTIYYTEEMTAQKEGRYKRYFW